MKVHIAKSSLLVFPVGHEVSVRTASSSQLMLPTVMPCGFAMAILLSDHIFGSIFGRWYLLWPQSEKTSMASLDLEHQVSTEHRSHVCNPYSGFCFCRKDSVGAHRPSRNENLAISAVLLGRSMD